MIAMDMGDVRGLGDVFALVAFLGVIWWAYGPRRKTRFEEDGNLPFADEQVGYPVNEGGEQKR